MEYFIRISGLCSCLLFLLPLAMGAPATTTILPPVCVDNLVGLVTCLNSSAVSVDTPSSRSNIVDRCNSLSGMAKCKTNISPGCMTLPAFRDLDSLFGFATRIAGACSSPAGRKNMLDLTECNDKIHDSFETCFNFTVIDKALTFGNAKDDFSSMCCVVRNGQRCYSPTVVSKCGQKGKTALDNTAGFLIQAMDCNEKSLC